MLRVTSGRNLLLHFNNSFSSVGFEAGSTIYRQSSEPKRIELSSITLNLNIMRHDDSLHFFITFFSLLFTPVRERLPCMAWSWMKEGFPLSPTSWLHACNKEKCSYKNKKRWPVTKIARYSFVYHPALWELPVAPHRTLILRKMDEYNALNRKFGGMSIVFLPASRICVPYSDNNCPLLCASYNYITITIYNTYLSFSLNHEQHSKHPK